MTYTTAAIPRLDPANSAFLVIDVQDKLLALIPEAPRLLLNCELLLDAASLLQIPILATEQYPRGLGPTHRTLAERIGEDRPSKLAFSAAGVPAVERLTRSRSQVVLAGIEAHVCVLQTALDLLEQKRTVFVVVDAIASRFSVDRELALDRLRAAGAVLLTAEMAVFEWLRTAESLVFKDVSRLIQDRARRGKELGILS